MPAVSRRRFDYSVPERWRADMRAGARVRIPFHGRRVGAWVTELDVEPPPGVVVQAITGVSGYGPPARVLDLAEWGAWRWAMPTATLLRIASPERNVLALPGVPAPVPMPARAGGALADGPVGAGTGPDGRIAVSMLPEVLGRTVTLVREAPAHDLLPIVLDVIERVRTGRGIEGASGRSAAPVLVLVPAVGWAQRLSERLRRRGVQVAETWAQAAAGWPVVVGSRAAAWSPIERLGGAVVLDAHDYADRYDASEVAVERCRRDGAPCVLVSPCPTAVQRGTYGPPVVGERSSERAGWPATIVVDRRTADPRTGLYSEELVALAHRVLPGRLLCVLNRTGRARLLACAACGTLARCDRCGRPVEQIDDRLSCRACGATRPVVCTDCGATRMKVLRQGVSRVREELASLIGVEVGEVWGPLSDDPVPSDSLIVGTEAVLHRVRSADAVAFLDFDQHLLAPRFVAGEQALALLARAARLVGGRSGTVLVQTRLGDHEVLAAAVAGDPGLFTELEVRSELDLPPATALARVRAETPPDLDGVEVSPLGVGQWLVRAPDHRVLCDAVATLGGGVTIDPLDV